MAIIHGEITLSEMAGRVANLQSITADEFKPIWPAAAQLAVSDVKSNFNNSWSPEHHKWVPLAHARPNSARSGTDKPLQDRGFLYASIQGKPLATGAGIQIGTNVEYANLHQFGGVITPKRAKFLAIPLTKEAKRAGSPRRFETAGRWQFRPTRTGGWIMLAARPLTQSQRRAIYTRRFQGRELTAAQRRSLQAIPQYVLVREVRVPARPFLGFSDGVQDQIAKLIQERFQIVCEMHLGRS